MQRIKLRGSGAPEFSYSAYETIIMTWLSSSGRGVSFGGFSGDHGPSVRAKSAA